jgi:hypothetical protein
MSIEDQRSASDRTVDCWETRESDDIPPKPSSLNVLVEMTFLKIFYNRPVGVFPQKRMAISHVLRLKVLDLALVKHYVMIKSILLLPFHFNGTECLGIGCSLDRELEEEIRRLKGVKWSGQYRCWFLPLTKESYQRIKDHLYGKVVFLYYPLKSLPGAEKAITPLVKSNQISKRRAYR